MRIVVLGGGGQVARAVVHAAPAAHSVAAKSHGELDIADETQVVRILESTHPDWIINAAAYTAVDLAEDHPGQARAANDAAVGVLARAAARTGCRLLHLSTDFVFDGTANRAYLQQDRPNPLSVYGATKLEGERRALEHGASIVLRTAWVYAAAGRNFVLTMLRLMREREQVRVVCDQIGTPTWATSIAGAVWGLIDSSAAAGIYHWTDLGVASWYDFAVAIQDEGLSRGLLTRAVPILPIGSADYPTRARRPTFSVLDTESTRRLIKAPARHWRHNLRMMLDELRAQ
jgi:dTDP-4-dehydrorhamnose reductase